MARCQARVTEKLLLVDWHANRCQLLLTAYQLFVEQRNPGHCKSSTRSSNIHFTAHDTNSITVDVPQWSTNHRLADAALETPVRFCLLVSVDDGVVIDLGVVCLGQLSGSYGLVGRLVLNTK